MRRRSDYGRPNRCSRSPADRRHDAPGQGARRPISACRNIDSSARFIVGGQITGEPPRLFLVYSEGNLHRSSSDTPYMQIGEIKYGKPIFDRIIHRETSISDAVKCTLVSFDATMRSNLSVGAPIDLLVYEKDALRVKFSGGWVKRWLSGDHPRRLGKRIAEMSSTRCRRVPGCDAQSNPSAKMT